MPSAQLPCFAPYDLSQRLHRNSYIARAEREARPALKIEARRCFRSQIGALPSARGAGTPIGDRNRFAVLEDAGKNGGRSAEATARAPDPWQRAIVEAEREGGGAERRPKRVADVESGLVQRRGKVRPVDGLPHHACLQWDARREKKKAPDDHGRSDQRDAIDDRDQDKIEERIS